MTSLLGAGLVLVACATDATSGPPEATGQVSSALLANGGFETGAAGAAPASWTLQDFVNPGITVQTPQTFAGLDLAAGGRGLTTTIAATNQADPNLGAGASLRVCRYGAQCARVNFHSSTTYGNGQNVNILSQTMKVAAGDVDPADGQIHVRFAVAPVLQNPAHPANEQPYYFVIVTDTSKGTSLYSDFNLSGAAGLTWQKVNAGTANEIDYTDWQLIDVSGVGGAIAQGDNVEVQIVGAGCSLGGHFGEVYVDGSGPVIPGLTVEGTAPAQANPGTNITYSLTYKNGSATAETGVAIDFVTPPGTTFQAVTPPAGATCTKPAVGAAGTVTCTFTGSVAAAATGSFTVTVAIAAGTTGTLTESNYRIRSTQETPLVGPPIRTLCGCTQDSNCAAGDWCNESANDCQPTLPNGTAVPSDPLHSAPTLNGKCTAAAGALVCTSAVCDTADNACGYANGDGPCTAANGGTVCRSATCSSNGKCEPAGGCNVDADCAAGNWCDESAHACTAKIPNGGAVPTDAPHTNPTLNGVCSAAAGTLVCVSAVCDTADSKCGYANGDGPCTTTNGSTVCRSGACSANGKCEPPGGCNVDADCAAGNWCKESAHTCTPKLANGTAVPTDAPHTNPTLNGVCSASAGALVCTSAVCDTADSECGYANGDGPCTTANGATVCRSGACSADGKCEPRGGCNVDADCAAGNWCDEAAHTCTATLPDGTAIPTDAPHTNPTLDGMCTAAAGALVCVSAVCDTADGKCGYANGDGPCTLTNGATVCRSGTCSADGTCVPAGACNLDADCAAGYWCSESAHTCTPKLTNGTAVPSDAPHTNPTLDGTCTAAAGTLVCTSGVCDTADSECGYANGDGPCTATTGSSVCRSGMCSMSGTCEPASGCNADDDCTAGYWCNESLHTCKAKLTDGTALPTDTSHMNPTLDGTCSASAAVLVCISGECDPTLDTCGAPSDAGLDGGLAVVDSGAGEGGSEDAGEDAAATDAGEDAAPEDAQSPPEDAAPEAQRDAGVDAGDGAYLEGGGCSSTGGKGGGARGTLLGSFAIFGVFAARRRRARRAAPR